MRGIPLPHTPFKLLQVDGDARKVVSTCKLDGDKLVLSCKDRNTVGSFFQLVPAASYDAHYHILSLESGLAVTEGQDGNLAMERLDDSQLEDNQTWEVIASSIFEDGNYLIQNCDSRRLLASGPFEAGSTTVFTLPEEKEIERHLWIFSYTEGDNSGIPPTQRLFRLMNCGTGKFLRADPVFGVLSLRDKLTKQKELHFRLVATRMRIEFMPSAYLIESVGTSWFLSVTMKGLKVGSEFEEVKLSALNEKDKLQFWTIVPSSSVGAYVLVNCGTGGLLLNGTSSAAGSSRLTCSEKVSKKTSYQNWVFSLV